MFGIGLLGVLSAWVLGEADPTGGPLTTILGQLGTVGAVVAYAYWRQRHADDLLKQRDATIAEMTKTMIELVVPTLEKTASSSNEVRHALERIIEAQRRGDYASTDERRIRER